MHIDWTRNNRAKPETSVKDSMNGAKINKPTKRNNEKLDWQ